MLHGFLGSAAIYDARSHRIPNLLILIGYGFSFYVGTIFRGSDFISIFFFRGLLPYCFLIPYFRKQIGAGDVKCLSVLSTIIGLKKTGYVLAVGMVLLGGYCLLRYHNHSRMNPIIMPMAPALYFGAVLLELCGKL